MTNPLNFINKLDYFTFLNSLSFKELKQNYNDISYLKEELQYDYFTLVSYLWSNYVIKTKQYISLFVDTNIYVDEYKMFSQGNFSNLYNYVKNLSDNLTKYKYYTTTKDYDESITKEDILSYASIIYDDILKTCDFGVCQGESYYSRIVDLLTYLVNTSGFILVNFFNIKNISYSIDENNDIDAYNFVTDVKSCTKYETNYIEIIKIYIESLIDKLEKVNSGNVRFYNEQYFIIN